MILFMKRLTIASRVSEAEQVHQALMPDVAAQGYSADAQFAIRLALDEALANAIWHGNGRDEAKKVVIEYEVNDQSVAVTVRDQGPGFNPNGVPDPTRDENLQKPHGRGIMLMRAYMSDVRFSDDGNCVTLVKERHCTRPHRTAG